MFKRDLVLSNRQRLICHKHKQTKYAKLYYLKQYCLYVVNSKSFQDFFFVQAFKIVVDS